MEAQTSDHGHVIEVSADVPYMRERGTGGSNACEGLQLWIAVVLCIVFMSVEVAGGIKAKGLAILTDAARFAIRCCLLCYFFVFVVLLVYEAIARLVQDTGEVEGFLMLIMALLLGHDHRHGHSHDRHRHGSEDDHTPNRGVTVTRYHLPEEGYHN